jgi:ComF family protein
MNRESIMPITLFDRLLDLLFPDACVACGSYGALFCRNCRRTLRPYPPGDSLPEALDAAEVACVYDERIQAAVHALKYRRQRRVARSLGEVLARHLKANPLPGDALIAVPLHKERLLERGFNQAELLAQAVAQHTSLPLAGGLARQRDTGHQARLSRLERQQNIADAFAWRAKTAPPRRVLLVDDVLTTGATLAACAVALRAAGTQEVRAVAVARSLVG